VSHMKEGHPLHVYETKMIWGDTYEGSMVGQNAAHQKGMPRARRVKWWAKSLGLYGSPVCGNAVGGSGSLGAPCQCTPSRACSDASTAGSLVGVTLRRSEPAQLGQMDAMPQGWQSLECFNSVTGKRLACGTRRHDATRTVCRQTRSERSVGR
jgi:hypothetical protein